MHVTKDGIFSCSAKAGTEDNQNVLMIKADLMLLALFELASNRTVHSLFYL